MQLINLCPHAITIGDYAIPPSGTVARVEVNRTRYKDLELDNGAKLPVYVPTFGCVENLPEPQADTVYLVSVMVRTHPAVRSRDDVCSPGQLVRDGDGNILGCDGLDFN